MKRVKKFVQILNVIKCIALSYNVYMQQKYWNNIEIPKYWNNVVTVT